MNRDRHEGGYATDHNASDRLSRLQCELDDLLRRLPAHSVPPAMMMRREEIEDEISRLRRGPEETPCP